MDDTTINEILDRVSKTDICILNTLINKKCINSHTGISKIDILKLINEITDFKFQISIRSLYLANLIDKCLEGKVTKYYINGNGKLLLSQYKKSIAEALNEIQK
jgi:hypothetical protein